MTSVALIVLAVALGRALVRRHRARTPWQAVSGWLAAAALLVVAVVVSPGSFELRKFVGLCLMPAGLVWLGLLAFTSALAHQGSRRKAAVALGIWVLYSLAGNAWFGGALAGLVQRGFDTLDPFGQGSFDAVVVLGGGVEVRDDGAPMLTPAGDRVLLAVRLFRAGKAAELATCGPFVRLRSGRTTSQAAATATLWTQLGVPAGNIVLLEGPRTTTDEVVALRRVAADRGWRRVGLLTSAWHLRRAMRLCRRKGVEVEPLPADSLPIPQAQLRWVVPQELGFWRVQVSCWETLGALAGR